MLDLLQTIGTRIALRLAVRAMRETNRISSENEKLTKQTHRRICKMHYEATTAEHLSLEEMKVLMGLQLGLPGSEQDQDTVLKTLEDLQDQRMKAIDKLKNTFLGSQRD